MFLDLKWPATWPVCVFPGNRFEVQVEADNSLVLHVCTQRVLPIDPESWIRQAFLPKQVAGNSLRMSVERGRTQVGWPLIFAFGQIVDENGRVQEERLGAFYRLLSYGAEAVVIAKTPHTIESHRAELESLLLSASAKWPERDEATLSGLLSVGLTAAEL
jgi:hypothetical protein